MLGSLFCGISGLKANASALSIIGDNVANVNTPGFKRARLSFENYLVQQLGTGADEGTGGGVVANNIFPSWEQGSLETTGTNTDLAISGKGLFKVVDGNAPPNVYYTRAGEFRFDATGQLINPDGYIVQGFQSDGAGGWGADPVGITIAPADYANNTGFRNVTIGNDGIISGIDLAGAGEPEELFQVALYTVPNLSGLKKEMGNLFTITDASGAETVGTSNVNEMGSIVTGAVELSNVDLATEFVKMITTQRAYQANSRVVSTSDEILQELINLKR